MDFEALLAELNERRSAEFDNIQKLFEIAQKAKRAMNDKEKETRARHLKEVEAIDGDIKALYETRDAQRNDAASQFEAAAASNNNGNPDGGEGDEAAAAATNAETAGDGAPAGQETRGTGLFDQNGARRPALTIASDKIEKRSGTFESQVRDDMLEIRKQVRSKVYARAVDVRLTERIERRMWREWLVSGRHQEHFETRAMTIGNDRQGGYTLPPPEFVAGYLEDLSSEVVMRRLATIRQVRRGVALGRRRREGKLGNAEWGTELSIGPERDGITWGARIMNPKDALISARVSNDLLQESDFNMESIVSGEMVKETSELEERAFMTGDGANKPLGIFVNSPQGITEARDVVVGTPDGPTLAGLKRVKWALKRPYWSDARWLMHSDIMERIDRLVDSRGLPLLQPDIRQETGYVLLGIPIELSDFAPNTFAANSYGLALASFGRGYEIVDSLDVTMRRSDEVYFTTNEALFALRKKVDAQPVLEEAFVRGTL